MVDNELPWPAGTRLVRLGEIEIDPRYRSVSRAGVVHELNPRCFELLLLFLREPRVLHTRDAIFRRVWRGAVVEDANLTTSIWLLRRALGGAAKQWIRTISKQGYIFDPPANLEIERVAGDDTAAATTRPAQDADTDADLQAAAPAATAMTPDARAPAPPLRAGAAITRGWMAALTAAACLSLMLLAGGLLGARGRDAAATRVILVAAADPSLPESQRWPLRLLQHWLSWQLGNAPQVELRSPSDALADGSETVVLLELGTPAQGGEWRVSAHFRGNAAQPPIVRQAGDRQLVAAIAAVGDAVFARLTGTGDVAAPPLALDAAAARQLADAFDAEQQHRWNDAVRAYTGIVAAAPAFGLARLRLARCLARLGQRGAAQAELARADGWLESLPEFLRAPLHAESLALREEPAAAAAAYAALQQLPHGDSAEYRVGEAAGLRLAGRTREAAARLDRALPAGPGIALAWLLEQAETSLANRDYRHAQNAAGQALELARTLGWPHEAAQASLLLADARSGGGEAVESELLSRAGQDFSASGDRLGALNARVHAELAQHDDVAADTLDQLLAEARSAGNAFVEIDALRRVGLARFRAGDLRGAHQRLSQAAAVAESAGNRVERRRIDLLLLQQDTLRLDFAALDARLGLLDAEPQQGATAYLIGLNRARLAYLRGDFDAALRTLESTENRLREAAGNLPQSMASLNCVRASIRIVQGRPADARTEFRACRSAGLPALDHFSDIGEAELAIQAGDIGEARRLLAPMDATPEDTPAQVDRWNLAMEVAPLFARIGDFDAARRIIDRTLPAVSESGYRMIETNLRITRAEIALAEGRGNEAEREVAGAEKLLPADYWYERRRARTVRALIAQSRGEIEAAAQALDALHADTRTRGDVLGELLVHSLMDANAAASRCPDERRLRLLAASGMRGASDLWMNPAGRARLVSAASP